MWYPSKHHLHKAPFAYISVHMLYRFGRFLRLRLLCICDLIAML